MGITQKRREYHKPTFIKAQYSSINWYKTSFYFKNPEHDEWEFRKHKIRMSLFIYLPRLGGRSLLSYRLLLSKRSKAAFSLSSELILENNQEKQKGILLLSWISLVSTGLNRYVCVFCSSSRYVLILITHALLEPFLIITGGKWKSTK